MKAPDTDRERSEARRTIADFKKLYNENLPHNFPQASVVLLKEYYATHTEVFKEPNTWSLDLHRKRVMDWLQARSTGKTEAAS